MCTGVISTGDQGYRDYIKTSITSHISQILWPVICWWASIPIFENGRYISWGPISRYFFRVMWSLKHLVRMSTRMSTLSLIMHCVGGITSGPKTLFWLSIFSSFFTPQKVTMKYFILAKGLLPLYGIFIIYFIVETATYWSDMT